MSAEFQYDVFLSHNAKDKPRVQRLAERLKKAGLRVWFDEWNVQSGDIIALKVDEGLEQSPVLLVCISPQALASGWVALERSTAMHRDPSNQERRFVPLLLADCELPDTLKRYKYIEFHEESEEGVGQIIQALKLDPSKASTPAPRSADLRLTFVSNSPDKLEEYRQLLNLPDLIRQPSPAGELQEASLGELVRVKCMETAKICDPPFFVEHTSFEVLALGAWPGVSAASFFARNPLTTFLKMLESHEGPARIAVAKLAIAFLAAHGEKPVILEEHTTGSIAGEMRGSNGFGWDQIFIPQSECKTYGEMTFEEKNRTSMRAKTARALARLLRLR